MINLLNPKTKIMKIKLTEKYSLQSQEDGFDLIRVSTAKHVGDGTFHNPTGDEYQKEETIAYNISLPTAINKIIHFITHEKEDEMDLKDYIAEYKKVKESIESIFKI